MAVSENPTAFTSRSYDFLIVGGGTAGLVLASRLSENPDLVIGVIEAGKSHQDDPKVLTPGLCATLLKDPEYDWAFHTTPQVCSQSILITGLSHGLVDAVLEAAVSINFTAIAYPTRTEINAWAQLGNLNWTWEALHPYFKKFHTYHEASETISSALGLSNIDVQMHGRSGPVQVSHYDPSSPLVTAWTATFDRLGAKMLGDPISGDSMGAFVLPAAVDPKTRTRSYAENAYLEPGRGKPNLHVLTDALASKVLFDESGQEESLTAAGIVFVHGEKTYEVKVTKEVILSAGAVKSPQILELSGIGGAELLQSCGISTLIDNPSVGENLQDHVLTALVLEVADDQITADAMRDPSLMEEAIKTYQTSRTGPLAGGAAEGSAFMPLCEVPESSSSANPPPSIMQLLTSTPLTSSMKKEYKNQFLVQNDMLLKHRDASIQYKLCPFQMHTELAHDIPSLFAPSAPGMYVSLTASLEHPYSRGSIHIHSADPTEYPTIDPKYLSHPLDAEVLARHLMYLEGLANSEPLASTLKPGGKRVSGLAHEIVDVDSAKKSLKQNLTTQYHPVGTCAMLPREDGGVVDDRLKVWGTKNLRVIDASIFPVHVRGNIQSCVYAVAEYAADMIKADW